MRFQKRLRECSSAEFEKPDRRGKPCLGRSGTTRSGMARSCGHLAHSVH